LCCVGQQHLRHARNLRSRVDRALRVVACDQHVDVVADLPCGSDGVQLRGLQRCAVMFGDNQNRHFA
jgi:hypothetical protein